MERAFFNVAPVLPIVIDQRERERARELVLRYGWNPTAYQILNPGLSLWFSAAGDAVAGYATFGRTWVVAGAPVSPGARVDEVIRELERDAGAAGAHVLYFAAAARVAASLAADRSHHVLRIGAQPVWSPERWSAVVRSKASLRAQLNRARNKGVAVAEWSRTHAERHPALESVRDTWLHRRGLPPLHFLTESDTLGDLRDRRVFVAEHHGSVVAFLVATPVPARSGWLIEQWPRLEHAPNGTMQLLVDAAMRAVEASGARYVTMGLAPLSELAGPIYEDEPLWLRMTMRWLRAHGQRFYNFRGLEAFKAAFAPDVWEPIYVAIRGRRLTIRDLRAIAGVFSGGAPERLMARALASAAARELRLGKNGIG